MDECDDWLDALPERMKQVLPKVIWEECVDTPHGREWTRMLRVLLAVQCPLQTSPITQPRVSNTHTAVPHASHMLGLHYIVLNLYPCDHWRMHKTQPMVCYICPQTNENCRNHRTAKPKIKIAVTFLHISHKSQHWHRTWLYLWKANELSIPTIYWP